MDYQIRKLKGVIKQGEYTFKVYTTLPLEEELLQIVKQNKVIFQNQIPDRIIHGRAYLIRKLEAKGLIKREKVGRKYLLRYTG